MEPTLVNHEASAVAGVEPAFVDREAFAVAGVVVRGKLGEIDYGAIWAQRYMPYDDQLKPLCTDKGYYGVTFATETPEVVEYLAGMAFSSPSDLPPGLVTRAIPPARYVVFACTVATIGETFRHIYGEWLPASPYEVAPGQPDFEYYPPGTTTDEAPAFVYVPIRTRAAA
jgi:predicted transcriptional regulator YdeE